MIYFDYLFSTTRQHLRCILLFEVIGHFVLLINVYISFFVSAINVAHSLYRGLSLVWQSSGLLVLCCNSSLRDFVGGSKVFCCQLLKLSSWKPNHTMECSTRLSLKMNQERRVQMHDPICAYSYMRVSIYMCVQLKIHLYPHYFIYSWLQRTRRICELRDG